MRIRNLVGLSLALVLLFSIATATDAPQPVDPADTNVTFPNGLTWHATLDDMQRVQGVDNINDFLLYAAGDVQEYWFANPEALPFPVGTYYVFIMNQLACHGIDYGVYEAEAEAEIISDLTEIYGTPAQPVVEQVVNMFNAYKPEAFPPDLLYSALGWMASDSTAVYYMNITDEMYVFYANEGRLFTADDPAD